MRERISRSSCNHVIAWEKTEKHKERVVDNSATASFKDVMKMTDLETIIDPFFLDFLQNALAQILDGKVSVVFEDLQSIPITKKYPRMRVFAQRKGVVNVCRDMIDCPRNPTGQIRCLDSDLLGAGVAKRTGKGYLYRCHDGRGFPNFLFPIKI